MDIAYEIAALVALIGLSGYFSGLEVALVSVRPSKIEQLIKDKVKGASSLHKLKSNPSRMMSSVNLGNNLASIAATALATDIALKLFGDEGLAIAIGIMTFLILIFSEISKMLHSPKFSKVTWAASKVSTASARPTTWPTTGP